MAFEEHIAQKCRLAVAMAVIKTKPPNIPTELYVLQLQKSILDSIPDEQPMDLDQISVSSMDFTLDCADSPNTIEDSATTQPDFGILRNCHRHKDVAPVQKTYNEKCVTTETKKGATKKVKSKINRITSNEENINIEAKENPFNNNDKDGSIPTRTYVFNPLGSNMQTVETMKHSQSTNSSVPQNIFQHDYSQKHLMNLPTENIALNKPSQVYHILNAVTGKLINIIPKEVNDVVFDRKRLNENSLTYCQNNILVPPVTFDNHNQANLNSQAYCENTGKNLDLQNGLQSAPNAGDDLQTQYFEQQHNFQKEKIQMPILDQGFQHNNSVYKLDIPSNAMQNSLQNFSVDIAESQNVFAQNVGAISQNEKYFINNALQNPNVLRNTDLLTQNMHTLTQNMDTLTQVTGTLTQRTGTLPQSAGTLSQRAGTLNTRLLTQNTDPLTRSTSTATNVTGTMTQSTGTATQNSGLLTQSTEMFSQCGETFLSRPETIPQNSRMPIQGIVPIITEMASQNYDQNEGTNIRNILTPEMFIENSETIKNNMLEEITQVLNETEAMDCEVPNCDTPELIEDDNFVSPTKKGMSFKVLLELNKIKNFLSNEDTKKTSTCDSGYKSEGQMSASQQSIRTGSQPSRTWLNQAASTLIEHICFCTLNSTHHQVTIEVSSTLAELIDALHSRESYPPFLDGLLQRVDELLEKVCGGGRAGREPLLNTEESAQRLFLLSQSVQIASHAIEELLKRLELFHEQLFAETERPYELSDIDRLEGQCYTFHVLETLIMMYLSKNRDEVEETTEEFVEDPAPIPKSLPSTISQVWLKRWDPEYKEPQLEKVKIKEKKNTIDRCGNVLNKFIVSCMDKYSLISYAALECYNCLQP